MREIKFRAWNQELKRMAYSDDVHFKTFGWWGVIVLNREPKTETGEIVMQYTGLKDKNGKEIYEGDVVKIRKKNWIGMKEVYWDEVTLRLAPATIRQTKESISIEILGNIYENPELLNHD